MTKKSSRDVRAEERRADAAIDVAAGLLDALVAGEAATAREFVSRTFRWFGRSITAEEWESGGWVAFFLNTPTTIGALRVIDRAVLELFPPAELEAIFDGPIGANDQVVLADVSRGDRDVTLACVVVPDESGTPRVDRAVDPVPFVERARGLGAAGGLQA